MSSKSWDTMEGSEIGEPLPPGVKLAMSRDEVAAMLGRQQSDRAPHVQEAIDIIEEVIIHRLRNGWLKAEPDAREAATNAVTAMMHLLQDRP